MRGWKGLAWLLLIVAAWMPGCGGGKSSLADYQATGCTQIPITGQVLLSALQDPALNGLRCVRWTSNLDETLTIDLINFNGACCASYDGSAEVLETGMLRLALVNTPCIVCACGACVYSFSFTFTGISSGIDLDVDLAEQSNPCTDQAAYKESFLLPIATRPSGLLCRYEPYMYEGTQHGTVHQPCRSEDIPSGIRCYDGLVCRSIPAGRFNELEDVCVPVCEVDADCPLSPLQSCVDGACLLAETLGFEGDR